MKNQKWQGCLALVLTVVMMFVVVFGIRTTAPVSSTTEVPTTAAASGAFAEAKDGTYTATTQGFGGDIKVDVTFANGAITDVQITGDSETEGLGAVAVAEMPARVLEAQSLDVDGQTGATISTTAIKTALADAFAQAGVSADAAPAAAETEAAPAEEAPAAEETAAAETEAAPAEAEAPAAEETAAAPAAETTAAGGTLADAADGTYTATTQGFGGDITTEVTIADGAITDVKITGDNETEGLGAVAVEKMPAQILEAQSLKVDGITGATVSSTAIITAMTDALAQAGVDASKLESQAVPADEKEKTDETVDVDVVVVGAGGAGMTAAIEATQAGKKVLILEKMPYVGGNTTKASGGMNAAGTKMQAAAAEAAEDKDVKAAIEDSTVENFIADTMAGGHDINDEALVRTMAENSADAIDWLESIGAPLPALAATGGTVHYYLHEPEDGSAVGEYLVQFYNSKLDELGIEVMLETKATELIVEDGKVVGVKAESPDANLTVNAGAVILATGGFGANFDMLASYDPALANAVTTNTPAATGDGIVMAQAAGADTVDMEQIQLHPTVYQENGLLVSERLRSNGAILINKEGKRFTNDLATRDAVSQAELQQTDACAYIVYDSKYAEEKLYQKYETNGITVSSDTLEGLAEAIGLEGDAVTNFTETVEQWNKVCAGEAEDEFGRNNGLVSLDQAPFTAILIAPGVHHTMGGLKIDTSAEVLNTEGEVIPGLFAAGEVTGGVHGGNRIGGNAVCDIVVYGRIAGKAACGYVDGEAPAEETAAEAPAAEETAAAETTAAGGTLADAADGTYTATTQGFGGDITTEVTIADGAITDVKITGDNETEGLGAVAVEKMPAQILEAQSLKVDGITGATVSSTAIITAMTDALAQAGVDASKLESQAVPADEKEKTDETVDVDVVVVGAGGAGMSAAITAKQAGKNVIILEKMPYVGGNTTKATGGMNAAETHYQKEQGIEDTVEQFVEDTMEGGKQINDKDLVTVMAENSADAIDWLDSINAPLPKVSFSGGATNARIHAPEDGSGVGEYLVAAFSKTVEEQEIPVYLETKATEIIMEDGKAVGVKAESEDKNYTINASAVILATGGFGANEEMYCSYRPDLKGSVTTNAPGATGDGIVMAEAVGAGLVDIDQIQLHPTVEQTTSMLITESVRGDGAILVNQSGKRFTNEMLTRDKVSAAELEQEGSYAYVIFDQNLRDGLKAIEKYVKAGIVVEADTIEALAEQIEIDPETLAETLSTWNECVANQKDEEFGRDTGMDHDLSVAPYYAIKIAPGIHHTMGGVKIDTKTEVMTEAGEVIPGLFAAGEVVGGVHGGNRIGGNAVCDIVVYGRIAGQTACDYVDAQ